MPSIPSGIMKRKTIALSEDKKEPKCCDATAVSAQRSIGLEINGMAAVSTAEPVTSQYIPWGVGMPVAQPSTQPVSQRKRDHDSADHIGNHKLSGSETWCEKSERTHLDGHDTQAGDEHIN